MAAVLTVAAHLLRWWMRPFIGGRFFYALFYAAVACTAAFAGLRAGIFALACGALSIAAELLWFPEWGPGRGLGVWVGFFLYVCVSVLLLYLFESQQRARRHAEEAALLAEDRRLRLDDAIALRHAAEARKELRERWFETTLASIGDGVIATDTQGRVEFLNAAAAALTGWTREEAAGRPVQEIVEIFDEDTGARIPNPVERALNESRTSGIGERAVLVARGGRRTPIDDSGAPILGSDGQVQGSVLVFRNVEQLRARESELRLRQRMIDLSHDAIIIADAERRISGWNTGAQELYGYTAAEAIGRVIHELLHTRDAAALAECTGQVLSGGRWDGELVHRTRDGSDVISESRQILMRDSHGAVAGVLEINRDATERRRAEENLRLTAAEAEEGRRTLHALLRYIPEGIAIADAPDGRIRAVSSYAQRASDRAEGDLLGVPLNLHAEAWGILDSDGRTPADGARLPLARALLKGDIVTDEEWCLRRPDGNVIPIVCSAAPIRDAGGNITGGLFTWHDLSHRKRLEERLRQAAKLESLGVLAGGIAHDFNNLLTAILGNACLLEEEAPPESRSGAYARAIVRTTEHAARLTQQMLAYSGRGRFVVEPVDLSEYVRDLAALISASIPKSVELSLELAADLPLVEADVAQLQQVVMNLAVNGGEAAGPEGGRLEIRTRVEELGQAELQAIGAEDSVRPGTYVVLEVQDTGCGMDRATVARIFDPFFTTKFTGRGLGLAAVQGIVRGHSGAIYVDSAPGAGTTFRVLLPASPARRSQVAASAPAPDPPSGTGTVMVVDDEDAVRSVAQEVLSRLGYRVVLASSGEEAVETYSRICRAVGVVILDMTMPGYSGEETLQRLRTVDPKVRVLLSSGFGEAEALERFGDLGLAGFLQKPYTVRALADKVYGVMKTIVPRAGAPETR